MKSQVRQLTVELEFVPSKDYASVSLSRYVLRSVFV